MDDHPLTKPAVRAIVPYKDKPRPGVNMANNASLHPTSAKVKAALRALADFDVRHYPDLSSAALRAKVAERTGVQQSAVVTGNGSNDIIDLALRAFCDVGTTVAYTPPTFSMFAKAAAVNAAKPVAVPLGDDYALDVEGLIDTNARVTIIAAPNNPTGTAHSVDDLRAVAEGVDGIVIMDEAYVEFHDDDTLPLLSLDNVLITRTLSKAYGLAAARVGYAIAPAPIAQALEKTRGPYRLNPICETLAVAALDDPEHMRAVVADVKEQRARVAGHCTKLGLAPAASVTNFLLCRHPAPVDVEHALADEGYHVRAFPSVPMLEDRFRFTIGPAAINDGFLAALERVMEALPP